MKKGSKHSEESKEKMSDAHKGLTHSEDTKKRISQSNTKGLFNNEQSNNKQPQSSNTTTEND